MTIPQAIEFEIKRIEELCSKVTSGGTPSRKNQEYYTGSIPWIKTGELTGWFIKDTSEKITEEAIGKSSAKIYPRNTVLMAMYGDGKTIGSTGITNIEAASNQACCAMIPDTGKVDPLFLLYSLKLHRETIVKLALGGAQRNLNQGTIKNYELLVPSLEYQRKISKALANYDYLIENNNRRIAILEEMAQSLYREWFVKFRFPGHEQCQMVESPLGLIPEGWEVLSLKEFCSQVIDGTHDSPKPSVEGHPLVTGKHIKGGTIDFSDTYLISEEDHQKVMARSRPEQGDILFTNIGTLGSACLVDQPFEYSIKNVALFKPRKNQQSYYLYLLMTSQNTISQMLSQASGTSQKFLSLTFLRKFNIVSPSNEALKEFDEAAKPIFELKKNLQDRNFNLKNQRDLLLPKLIGGQIELG